MHQHAIAEAVATALPHNAIAAKATGNSNMVQHCNMQ